jgi:hypothetical protein
MNERLIGSPRLKTFFISIFVLFINTSSNYVDLFAIPCRTHTQPYTTVRASQIKNFYHGTVTTKSDVRGGTLTDEVLSLLVTNETGGHIQMKKKEKPFMIG